MVGRMPVVQRETGLPVEHGRWVGVGSNGGSAPGVVRGELEALFLSANTNWV